MPKRLIIAGNMRRESTTQLLAVYHPPIPATPCHTDQNLYPAPISRTFAAGWDVVPLILEINGRYPDVLSSCITCLGVTDTLARRTKLAAASNPLTQARHHNLAELRIRGWDVDPSLSKSSGGTPNV